LMCWWWTRKCFFITATYWACANYLDYVSSLTTRTRIMVSL